MPRVSTVSALLHCTYVIHKDVLSHKLHYLLLQGVMKSPSIGFLPLPWGEWALKPCRPCLVYGREGSYQQDERWGLTFGRIPALRIVGSEMQEVLRIGDSQRDRKSRAGPPFLPALPTSWGAEPQATASLESWWEGPERAAAEPLRWAALMDPKGRGCPPWLQGRRALFILCLLRHPASLVYSYLCIVF